MSKNYYDDPYMMGMEGEYTVVDYTQPSTQDFNNPNTDKSVAIVDQSPKYSIQQVSIFVEEIIGPVFLGRDQQLEVLNLLEAGEIVSIELVTDNPYVALYIEMDDFKYKTPNGMSAAELLLRGRDEYSERHFYVEGPRPDGMYVVKFHPRTDYQYHDRLKILVRNDITKTSDFRGLNYSYSSRSSLPSPMKVGFNGGAVANVPNNSAVLAVRKREWLGAAIATGIDVEMTEAPITNDVFRTSPLTQAGVMHPFVGNAGKVSHESFNVAISSDTLRAVWGAPGVAISSTAGVSTNITTTPFPGAPIGDVVGIAAPGGPLPSTQQLMIYASNAESETATTTDLATLPAAIFAQKVLGNPLFYSVGDKVYYPGELANIQWYDDTVSEFVEFGSTSSYDPVNDGAILLTFKPGFDFTPPKGDLSNTGYDTLGYLDMTTFSYEAIVQEVNVKRKKKRVLN
mgnify:CR=1 FL=1